MLLLLLLFDPNPLTNSFTSALNGLQGDDLKHSSGWKEHKTKLVCFAEGGRKHSNKTAMRKLKTELSTTEGRDLRIKIPAQAKLEKEGTLDPLEEGFEHIGDALLVWQCSILGGGG